MCHMSYGDLGFGFRVYGLGFRFGPYTLHHTGAASRGARGCSCRGVGGWDWGKKRIGGVGGGGGYRQLRRLKGGGGGG